MPTALDALTEPIDRFQSESRRPWVGGVTSSLRSQEGDPLSIKVGVHTYHALRTATGRNPRQRFWLVSALFRLGAFATGCHWLRPLGSIIAPSSSRRSVVRRRIWEHSSPAERVTTFRVERGSKLLVPLRLKVRSGERTLAQASDLGRSSPSLELLRSAGECH